MTLEPASWSALYAVAYALGMTPVVLLIADRTTCRHRRLGTGETIAVATLIGIVVSVATSGGSAPEAASMTWVLMIALAASIVDTGEGRLPNELTAGLAVVSTAAVLTRSAQVGEIEPLLRAVLVAGLVLTGCLLMKVADDDAVGWGDVKFAPTLAGVVAAWRPDRLLLALVVTVVLVGVSAAGVALLDRTRRASVPYGPALTLGAVAGLAVAL